MSTQESTLDLVHVVVPAHNEERRLGSCLDSVARAAARLRARGGPIVRTTVVLDSCSDASELVAADHAVDVVVIEARSVGRAREHGVGRVIDLAAGLDARRVWVAMTDADSVVPRSWLSYQVGLAARGCELAVGPIHPDPTELSVSARNAWRATYADRRVLHIHGTNLGFTLAAHARAGGFPPLSEHEDVTFVNGAIAAGVSWSSGGPSVRTSARIDGRTAGGFAGYIRDLVAPKRLTD